MSDKLDETISNCFKKVDTLKKDLKELTLLLGHLEEKAKKLRDDLNKKETLEIKSLSNNEYEVYQEAAMIITREQFRGYQALQGKGYFNMYDTRVLRVLKISRDQHKFIIGNYNKLEKYFSKENNERKKEKK